ncbi:MAG: hypothetical protein FWD85_06965 [Microbacteriaceae bacterium]|nr:hypothetical protein [Microbacteriaceae bacterium]
MEEPDEIDDGAPLWWVSAPVVSVEECERLEVLVEEELGAEVGTCVDPMWHMRFLHFDLARVESLRVALDNRSGARGVAARRDWAGFVLDLERFLSVGSMYELEIVDPRDLGYAARVPRAEVMSEALRTPELLASALSESQATHVASGLRSKGLRPTVWDPYVWHTEALSRMDAMHWRAMLIEADSLIINDRGTGAHVWEVIDPRDLRNEYSLESFDEFLALAR